jgi:hypothetical protein
MNDALKRVTSTLKLNITYENFKNTPLPLHDKPEQIKHLELICEEDWFMGLCRSEEYIWSREIWSDKTPPCILFKNIVSFTNLVTLKLECVALETQYWVEFAMNSKCLKDLEISLSGDKDERDLFNFSEEAFESLMKIPTLENVYFSALRTDFFPKGSPTEHGNEMMKKQSNVKSFKIKEWQNKNTYNESGNQSDYWNWTLSSEFINSFGTNIGTYKHLERLEIDGINFETNNRDFELLSIINNCPNFENVSISIDSCKLETLIQLLKMPRIKSIKLSIDSDLSCGTEDATELNNCDFSNLEYFNVHYYISSECPNLYEEIYAILKNKCASFENENFIFSESGI